MPRPAPRRASLCVLVLFGGAGLVPGLACRATAPVPTLPEGEAPIYLFPRSELTVVRPDAVLFYTMDDDEIDGLPPAEREGLRALLPDFYAVTLRIAATLRERGIRIVRSSSPRFRFEDTDGRAQFYERALHPGGAGMVLFRHGGPIEAHPGVPSETEILAAVETYFSKSGPDGSPGPDSGEDR
jgi:hypothetical protein